MNGSEQRVFHTSRSITSLLVMVLLCTLMPLSAFAEDSLSIDLEVQLENNAVITEGNEHRLRILYENTGDVYLREAQIRVVLPEELQLYRGSELQSIGFLSIAQKGSLTVSLSSTDQAETKSYPVQIELSGVDGSGSTQTVSRTFYLPVKGSKASEKVKLEEIEIVDIGLPQEADCGQEITLSFRVRNTGEHESPRLRIRAELPEGLMNRSSAQFTEASLAPGQQKHYQIRLFSKEDASEGYYPISLQVEALEVKEGETTSQQQYTGIFLREARDGDAVKTPRLMVTSVSYGGEVTAGERFPLQFQLYNTSQVRLRNIAVSVSSDGTFLPTESGSTLYIESMEPQESRSCSLMLLAKSDTEPKTAAVDVDLAYEDSGEESYSTKTSLSIPVRQRSRLTVEEISSYGEFYVGMQGEAQVDFYNMGKSTLYNLRIAAEGNFETVQSTSTFVGNMAAGASDDYSFAMLPTEAGKVEGTVTFTFEDSNGAEETLTKAFSFPVLEAAPWEEPDFTEEPMEEPPSKTPWIALAGIAILLIAGLFFRRHRKKMRDQMLELEEL